MWFKNFLQQIIKLERAGKKAFASRRDSIISGLKFYFIFIEVLENELKINQFQNMNFRYLKFIQWHFSQYYSFDANGMPMRFDVSFKSFKLTVIDFLTTMKNLQYMLEKMKCWAMFIKIVPFNPDRGQHSTIESQHGFEISATSFLSLKQTSSTSESYRKIIRSDSEQEMKEEINKLHKYLGCIHLLNTRKYCDNTHEYCGNT